MHILCLIPLALSAPIGHLQPALHWRKLTRIGKIDQYNCFFLLLVLVNIIVQGLEDTCTHKCTWYIAIFVAVLYCIDPVKKQCYTIILYSKHSIEQLHVHVGMARLLSTAQTYLRPCGIY